MKFLCKYIGHKYIKLWDFDVIDYDSESSPLLGPDYYNLYCKRCELFDEKRHYN